MPGTLNVGGHNIITHSGTSGAGTVNADNIDTVNIGNNALVVDSSGKVAIGYPTTSNQGKLVIAGGVDGSSVLTGRTDGGNGNNERFKITAFADGGGAGYGGGIGFETRSTTNVFSEAMRIDSNGRVQINRDAKGSDIAAGELCIFTSSSDPQTNTYTITSERDGTSDSPHFRFRNDNGTVGVIRTSGTSTSYQTSSDYRLKENITEITDGITRVKQLNPSRFNFITDPNTTVDGFIAHEVQPIVPEAISGVKDAVDGDGNPEYQGIDQSKLVPLLTAALQESIALIESQQSQIDVLTAKTQEQDLTIASLISRIEALENA